MTRALNTTLGAYRLLSRLNEGGTAEVFLAAARALDGRKRLVAIKRILPHLAEELDFTNMLIDEARLACQLVHPGIAQIIDLGDEDGQLFLAVEYVAGRDLGLIARHARKRQEPLPVELSCHIGASILEALDHAHEAKDMRGRPMELVHRDVSPANVLISWAGEVKVIDFGIARAANRLTKTQAGVLKGKFRYMSPEQASGLSVDARADVYAAAVVLHELLASEALFAGVSGFDLIQKVVEGKTPSLRGRDGIDDELAEVVERGLSLIREERWQTAGEFAQALRSYLARRAPGRDLGAELGGWLRQAFASEFETERRETQALLESVKWSDGDEGDLEVIEAGEATVIRPASLLVPGGSSSSPKEPTLVRPAPNRPEERPMVSPSAVSPPPVRAPQRFVALAAAGAGVLAIVIYLWL